MLLFLSLFRFATQLLIPISCGWNHGQACCAGSRIFVQSGIYDEFLKRFTEKSKAIKVGDPFDEDSFQGPLVSKRQFDVCVPLTSSSSLFSLWQSHGYLLARDELH